MGKYINLFNKTHNEFVRIFLFEKISKVEHFKSGLLISSRCFDSYEQKGNQSNELLKLLIGLNLPIELVIFHRSMAFKLFSSNVHNSKDLEKIAIHTLNNNHYNTVFYSKMSRAYVHPDVHYPKIHTYGLCSCDISDDLTKLLLTNSYDLKIISMSVFPLWVTSAFCNYYKCNVKNPVLFVIEYLGYLHIILMNNGCLVYNRSVLFEHNNDLLKEKELSNTLSHIENVMNVNIRDLFIYEFGSNVIDAISFYSTMHTKIASKMNVLSKIKTAPCNIRIKTSKYRNNITKVACLSFSGIVLSDISCNVYNINKTIRKIEKENNHIKSINKNIIKNVNIWDELRSRKILNQPNYKDAIQYYMKNKKSKLQRITMYWDEAYKKISCELQTDNDMNNNRMLPQL